MSSDFIPFIFLLASVLACRIQKRLALVFAFLAVGSGFVYGRLEPIAFLSIAAAGISIWRPHARKMSRPWKLMSYFVFQLTAIGLSNHLFPGFRNLPVFEKFRFSPDSIPFTMYLNLDKTLVGLFLLLFYIDLEKRRRVRPAELRITSILFVALLGTLTVLALSIGYVRWDPKFPPLAWIWVLNNLFFVCMAEEAFFRGFIQSELQNYFSKKPAIAVFLAAILFGLAHYQGGVTYIILAALAGGIYGWVFFKTKRIEAAIFIHFGINLVHFFLFSYPRLES